MIVDEHRVGVWRFCTDGGWPFVWHHGGLICGLDAKVIDMAAPQRGADIISIDRPATGRSDHWNMTSMAHWPHTVEQIANLLHARVCAGLPFLRRLGERGGVCSS